LARNGTLTRAEQHHTKQEWFAMTTLYTIGYEGTDIDRFVATLKAVGVQLLADVRALPLSRKRGFSKNGAASKSLAVVVITLTAILTLCAVASWASWMASCDAFATVDRLKERGPKDIRLACLIAVPEGRERIRGLHPDVPAWTAAIW
jgi:Protein of unknown function, DUF488